MRTDQQPPSNITTRPHGLATRNENPNIQDVFRKNWPHFHFTRFTKHHCHTSLASQSQEKRIKHVTGSGKQRISKEVLSKKDVSSTTILDCHRLQSRTASLPFSPPCFHRNHHHRGYPMHPARALGFHQVQPGL